MKRLVASLGYTVEEFASAADFLDSPRLDQTACLIADVHMPTMTGVELSRHLIEVGYVIPTILITGRPDDRERALALDDGVVCYLVKPIDEGRLVQCLHAALRSGEPPEEDP
jgi:FixJ family two-component response regulator